MRWLSLSMLLLSAATTAVAHHPDRQSTPARSRIDVIGPLGNRLPESYRREYNRPTYLGGKIAYWIAPSSQEAMAWHAAAHAGAYKNKCPRVEKHYFYPKTWEALRIGPRRAMTDAAGQSDQPSELTSDDAVMELPVPIESPSGADGQNDSI